MSSGQKIEATGPFVGENLGSMGGTKQAEKCVSGAEPLLLRTHSGTKKSSGAAKVPRGLDEHILRPSPSPSPRPLTNLTSSPSHVRALLALPTSTQTLITGAL